MYERKEHPIASYQTNCDINFLEIQYIRPAQRYLDLVTTHLHHIEGMSLKLKMGDAYTMIRL